MTSIIRLYGLAAALLFLVSFDVGASSQGADLPDKTELTAMLHKFLGTSDQREAHVWFWADDLVYTSSSGARFGKADILAGFEDSGEDKDSGQEEDSGPSIAYTGEDVDVRIFATTAIITFRLVGTPDDGSTVKNYFNTGTFLKRDGKWQAVTWQATIIPDE
jgi:hypothetical protein